MLDPKQLETICATIRSLAERCDASCEPALFDNELYQECIDEGIRRGYPMDGEQSLLPFMRVGTGFGATVGRHLNRAGQMWLAFMTACVGYVDETPYRVNPDVASIRLFSDRLMNGQRQEDGALEAFADLIRRALDTLQPIPGILMMTSSLNFFAGNLLEYETASMQIASAAQNYPVYYRTLSAFSEGYAHMLFPPELPITEYIQAMPEIILYINDINDVLSFYKEELAGENNTQICVMANINEVSRLDTFVALAEKSVGHYNKILDILRGSPRACEAFKHISAGYFGYHTSVERYKLADLNLTLSGNPSATSKTE